MGRRLILLIVAAVVAVGVAGGAPARAATPCGDHGWAAGTAEGAIYQVDGALRARNVSCDGAHRVVGRYLARTQGEGGPFAVHGFRCRGGPRAHHRYIVSCRRDGGAKRVFLDGTGGPR